MHANATLTPLRRAQMIAELVSSGASLRAIAARFGVCEKTVRRWRDRAQQLGSPRHLPDRSSTPRHQPIRMAAGSMDRGADQPQMMYAGMTSKSAALSDFSVLQAELVKRLYLDQTTIHDEHFKMPERDAVDFTSGIHGAFIRLFTALDAGLKPTDAERIKGFVMSVCVDVGRMAQSELQAGIIETALDRQSAAKPASAH